MVFKLPSFKILILFMTGIFIGKYFGEHSYAYWILGLGLLSLGISFLLHRLGQKIPFNILMIFSLIFLLMGYYHIRQIKPSNHLSQKKEVFVAFYGKVISYPKIKTKKSRFIHCKKQPLETPFQRQEYLIEAKEVRLKSGEIETVTGTILVKSKSFGRKLVQQVETGVFERLILKKLKNDQARTDVLKCYKKDNKQKYYRLKHGLKSDDVHKLYEAIRSIGDGSHLLYKEIEMGDWVTIQAKVRSIQGIKPCPQFDYRKYLTHAGIDYISYPNNGGWITIAEVGQLNSIEKWAGNAREHLIGLYNRWLPDQEGDLIKGLILGAKEGISEETLESFQKAGISHILAVSGLHVALIGAFLFVFFGIFRIPGRYILIIISIILVFYVYMVGYKASILRAVIMFYSGAIVVVLDRDRHYLNALCLSGVIILFYDPLSLFTLGFQLSFLATLGILVYFTRFNDRLLKYLKYNELRESVLPFRLNLILSWLVRRIVSLLALTLTAQILIAPLLVYHFGGYSLISIVSNIFIVVLAQGAVALALFIVLVSFSNYLIDIYSVSLLAVLKSLIGLSNYLSHLPFAYIDFGETGGWIFWIYYPLLLTILHFKGLLSWIGHEIMTYQKRLF